MITEYALKYLGHTGQQFTVEMESLLDECIREVKQVSQPKAVSRRFELFGALPQIKELGLSLPGDQIREAFLQCSHCLFIGATLGVTLERKVKYYEKSNMTKAAVRWEALIWKLTATSMKKGWGIQTDHTASVQAMVIFRCPSTGRSQECSMSGKLLGSRLRPII